MLYYPSAVTTSTIVISYVKYNDNLILKYISASASGSNPFKIAYPIKKITSATFALNSSIASKYPDGNYKGIAVIDKSFKDFMLTQGNLSITKDEFEEYANCTFTVASGVISNVNVNTDKLLSTVSYAGTVSGSLVVLIAKAI